MRTTHFTGVRTAVMAVTALGALSFVSAQIGLPVAQKGQKAAVTNLPNRTLQRTTFQATLTGAEATCGESACHTTAVVFTRPISCPVKAGKTCTLYLHLEGQTLVTANDEGFFRFLIDGLTPVPGPTGPTGEVGFAGFDPNSSSSRTTSFAVVGKVKNTSDNELHSIEVDFGCGDTNGDGCMAIMGFASLSTSVFTP